MAPSWALRPREWEILLLWALGTPSNDVASHFGVRRATIYRVVRQGILTLLRLELIHA